MMDWLLYLPAKCVIVCLQRLPLRLVARLGRACGLMVFLLDPRHRRVARGNLTRCFPGMSTREVRTLVRENFRRIGESLACGVKTASMPAGDLLPHMELHGVPDHFKNPPPEQPPRSTVVAIGHFGNFELYAHCGRFFPRHQVATTYRALRLDSINRLMQSLRETSGCLYFERRFDGARLRAAMKQPGMILGLLCDQDGGDRGLQLPFLGHNCSTSPAAALFALRYDCSLHTAICYRVGLARWRIEWGAEILTHEDGRPRSTEGIMRDVNIALEKGVRRDPANWFWVHNRWKRGRPDLQVESPAA